MTAAPRKVAAPAADLQSAIEACALARRAFEAATASQSTAAARVHAARFRVEHVEAAHAAIEAENDAISAVGGKVDQVQISTAAAELTSAKYELAAVERATRGGAAAIETLRERASTAHDVLSQALQIATAALRADAAAKYAAGLQLLRDALATTDALDDQNDGAHVKVPDTRGSDTRWVTVTASADVSTSLQPFQPALFEQRQALRRLLR